MHACDAAPGLPKLHCFRPSTAPPSDIMTAHAGLVPVRAAAGSPEWSGGPMECKAIWIELKKPSRSPR
jgi:hypothetical protein